MLRAIRAFAATLLVTAAVAFGVWAGYELRIPSIAFVGALAFVAFAAPSAFAIPVALCFREPRYVFGVLLLPIFTLSLTHLWFTFDGKRGFEMPTLLLAHLCASAISVIIAFSVLGARRDLRDSQHGPLGFCALFCTVIGTGAFWISIRNSQDHLLALSGVFVALGLMLLVIRWRIQPAPGDHA